MEIVKKFLELRKKDYLKLFTIKELWILATELIKNSINQCVVVGLLYYDYNCIEPYIGYDSIVTLHREPDNYYDKFAMVVFYLDNKIGYIRKEDNKKVEPGNYKIKQFKGKSLIIERCEING